MSRAGGGLRGGPVDASATCAVGDGDGASASMDGLAEGAGAAVCTGVAAGAAGATLACGGRAAEDGGTAGDAQTVANVRLAGGCAAPAA